MIYCSLWYRFPMADQLDVYSAFIRVQGAKELWMGPFASLSFETGSKVNAECSSWRREDIVTTVPFNSSHFTDHTERVHIRDDAAAFHEIKFKNNYVVCESLSNILADSHFCSSQATASNNTKKKIKNAGKNGVNHGSLIFSFQRTLWICRSRITIAQPKKAKRKNNLHYNYFIGSKAPWTSNYGSCLLFLSFLACLSVSLQLQVNQIARNHRIWSETIEREK